MRSQTRLTLGVALFAASLMPIATMTAAATPSPDDMPAAVSAADDATVPASAAMPGGMTDTAAPSGATNDMAAGTEQIQANPRGSDAPAVASPAPNNADAPVAPSMPADPNYHAGPYMGALSAPPASAMNRTYPLCRSKTQDECRQPHGR